MKVKKRKELKEFSNKASSLLIEIIKEELPKIQKPTKKDLEFQQLLKEIHPIYPSLSDYYANRYNQIQENKIRLIDTYYKKLRKIE